jgi:uncharacterized protein YjiS (DUF1127 family)
MNGGTIMSATTFKNTKHAGNNHVPAGIVAGLFHKLTSGITHQYRVHKTASALSALDDRELEDIGISRYDISKIAENATH